MTLEPAKWGGGGGGGATCYISPYSHFIRTFSFTRKEQHPSLDASGMVSFCASEEETAVNKIMSLMASDADEWACSGEEPEASPPSQSARPSMNSELIRVLTCAVEELGLA